MFDKYVRDIINLNSISAVLKALIEKLSARPESTHNDAHCAAFHIRAVSDIPLETQNKNKKIQNGNQQLFCFFEKQLTKTNVMLSNKFGIINEKVPNAGIWILGAWNRHGGELFFVNLKIE